LAALALRDHLHVAELTGQAPPAALHPAVEDDRATDAGAEGDHEQPALAATGAEPVLGARGGVRVVVHDDGQAQPLGQAVADRLVAPGQVGGEDDGGAVGRDEPGGADADAEHLTPGPSGLGQQPLHRVDDAVLHVARTGRPVRGVPAGAAEHPARVVDQSCGHLGAADVDADREPVVHGRHPTRRLAARSAAPTTPASLPSRAGTSGATGRCPRPVRWRPNAARAGPSSRSPAAATPPPTTMTPGSSTAARLARPSPSQRPRSSSSSTAAGSPSRAASVTMRPSSLSGSPSHRAASAAACGLPPRTSSLASRSRAEPLAYCSRQPRFPQPQRCPSGTTL